LLQRGEWLLSILHAAAHVLGALACVSLGYALARLVLRG